MDQLISDRLELVVTLRQTKVYRTTRRRVTLGPVTANFLTVTMLLGSTFVVALVLGFMFGRRSVQKHLAAAPQRFDELSAELNAAREESAKWKSASEKWQAASEQWQSASESWQSAANSYEETAESLKEVIRLKDVELESKK